MSAFDLEPKERVADLSDSILASVIGVDDVSRANRTLLFSIFTPKVFRNENHILYKILYNFKERNITPDEEFIALYLTRNLSVITESNIYVDFTAYNTDDERAEVSYITAVIKHFNRLKGMKVLPFEDFNALVEKFKLEYMAVELNEAYNMGKTILNDKLAVQGKKEPLQGYMDSAAFVKKQMADIDSIADTTTGIGFIDASVYGLIDDDEATPELIGNFGEIEELNNHLGGIYSSYFYSILAPTKGGKSKFTSRMIHNIMVEHQKPVVVWAHEGGYKAWLAQLRAIHFDWYYNRNELDKTKHKTGLSQERILKNDFPTEDIRKLEEVSRLDLFTNPAYGNLQLIDRPFKVESFIDEIETARQLNDAKVVLVDYLQLITTDNRSMSKPQALGQAYQAALAYAKKRNVAFISPAQMTQDFMNEMAKSKEGTQHELRTAGGETSEVIRTPDINIALYGSIEDIRNGTMKILSIPSRLCQPFESFDIFCDLSVCRFASLTTD